MNRVFAKAAIGSTALLCGGTLWESAACIRNPEKVLLEQLHRTGSCQVSLQRKSDEPLHQVIDPFFASFSQPLQNVLSQSVKNEQGASPITVITSKPGEPLLQPLSTALEGARNSVDFQIGIDCSTSPNCDGVELTLYHRMKNGIGSLLAESCRDSIRHSIDLIRVDKPEAIFQSLFLVPGRFVATQFFEQERVRCYLMPTLSSCQALLSRVIQQAATPGCETNEQGGETNDESHEQGGETSRDNLQPNMIQGDGIDDTTKNEDDGTNKQVSTPTIRLMFHEPIVELSQTFRGNQDNSVDERSSLVSWVIRTVEQNPNLTLVVSSTAPLSVEMFGTLATKYARSPQTSMDGNNKFRPIESLTWVQLPECNSIQNGTMRLKALLGHTLNHPIPHSAGSKTGRSGGETGSASGESVPNESYLEKIPNPTNVTDSVDKVSKNSNFACSLENHDSEHADSLTLTGVFESEELVSYLHRSIGMQWSELNLFSSKLATVLQSKGLLQSKKVVCDFKTLFQAVMETVDLLKEPIVTAITDDIIGHPQLSHLTKDQIALDSSTSTQLRKPPGVSENALVLWLWTMLLHLSGHEVQVANLSQGKENGPTRIRIRDSPVVVTTNSGGLHATPDEEITTHLQTIRTMLYWVEKGHLQVTSALDPLFSQLDLEEHVTQDGRGVVQVPESLAKNTASNTSLTSNTNPGAPSKSTTTDTAALKNQRELEQVESTNNTSAAHNDDDQLHVEQVSIMADSSELIHKTFDLAQQQLSLSPLVHLAVGDLIHNMVVCERIHNVRQQLYYLQDKFKLERDVEAVRQKRYEFQKSYKKYREKLAKYKEDLDPQQIRMWELEFIRLDSSISIDEAEVERRKRSLEIVYGADIRSYDDGQEG